ncbi:hypothetical protein EJD97_017748 [Solanum chilense]|uniref:RING-type domain-containing protein n=1 Tax=Solanum chilense TaxID=4083 RepID=A0A6N2B4X3_SOLCI|nr:hypothetical protein EJD97_017748 [Solanum chilense]
METMFYYSLPSSDACVVFSQIETPKEELNIDKDSNISSSLPLLSIRFHLRKVELCWYKPLHEPQQFQYYSPMFVNSLHLEYNPSIYASYDLFYNALRENMENLGEEFEDNYRSDIIRYIISEVRDVFDDESNKGREKVEVSVDTIFVVKRFVDKSILKDDCMICLEELEKKGEYQYYRHTRGDSLHLEYSPSIYMSYDLFYHALRENMEDLGEELEDNYRSDIIHVVIDKICGIVVDESSNHGREKVEVFVGIMFFMKRFVDKNILNNDCVICFEELGKEGSVMCTPCSHVFHEDCIAKWLANGNSCPICRRDLPDI